MNKPKGFTIVIRFFQEINGARIVGRDISYKYGSIHTLGRVLYPVASDSVQVFLDSNPFLSEFAAWYRKYARLPKNDMVTVFAPTNAAFERIAPSIRKNLAKNEVLKARKVPACVGQSIFFLSRSTLDPLPKFSLMDLLRSSLNFLKILHTF